MVSLDDEREFYNKCAILMVTYNTIPNFERIKTAFKYINKVIIIDNNSNSRIKSEILKFSELYSECIPIFNKSNFGISRAYNIGVNLAKSIGIEWLFFLDGDANFGEQYFIESYIMLKKAISLKIKLGVICPIVSDSEGFKNIKFTENYCFIKAAITSGIMINVNTFLEVGGYNESIFVESADLAFTKKILQSGMRICRINKILIIQSFGKIIFMDSNQLIKFFNFLSHTSSVITLKLGRLNVIRTRYPIYDPSRRRQYYQNLMKSSSLFRKPIIVIYSTFSSIVDYLFFKILGTQIFDPEHKVDEEVN